MKGNLDSVHILRRGGASEIVTDILGRTPSELQPEGLKRYDSDIDPESEFAGLDAGVYPEADGVDEQPTIVKQQLSALNLDIGIDSGHGQPDSENDNSENRKEPDGMIVDSLAGGDEGDIGGIAGGSGSLASDRGGAQFASSSKEPVTNIIAPSQATCREMWLMDIEAWNGHFQEMWYLNQEEEPLDHSGKSILFQWLRDSENAEGKWWNCCVPLKEDQLCGSTFRRLLEYEGSVRYTKINACIMFTC